MLRSLWSSTHKVRRKTRAPPHKHGHATLTGTVSKIIASLEDQAELIEIVLEGAEPLYCEIRIPNMLRTTQGQIIKLKPGDHVTLSVESS